MFGLYRSIGDAVLARWPGWRLFVFTSNDQLAKAVGLKVRSSVHFYNGKLPCKLWEFAAV